MKRKIRSVTDEKDIQPRSEGAIQQTFKVQSALSIKKDMSPRVPLDIIFTCDHFV